MISLLLTAVFRAVAATPSASVEFFEKNIRPVLVERCYPCHSDAAPKVKGGLKSGLFKSPNNRPAVPVQIRFENVNGSQRITKITVP